MLRLLLCQNIIGDLIMSNVVCKIYVIIALMLMASCSKEQEAIDRATATIKSSFAIVVLKSIIFVLNDYYCVI
jgi:hypothetical protein